MNRYGPLQQVVGHTRVHDVEQAVNGFVTTGPADGCAEDLLRRRIGDDPHEPLRLPPPDRPPAPHPCAPPVSIARPTRVMGRLPMSSFRPLSRACASVIPTRPSGGSTYKAYAGTRSLTFRCSPSSRLAATISKSL